MPRWRPAANAVAIRSRPEVELVSAERRDAQSMIHKEYIDYRTASDGVASVTLNRPEKINALNPEGMAELSRIWKDVANNSAVRAVVLSGAGERGFCAGSDLQAAADAGHMVSNEELLAALPGVTEQMDKPIIAALHGICIGTGVTLAAHCDIRIAAPRTSISLPEVRHGMIAAVTAARLPRMIPAGQAIELLVSGRVIDAEEAVSCGLVNRIADHPRAAAGELAASLAAMPPDAMHATIQLAHFGLSHDMSLAGAELDRVRNSLYENPRAVERAMRFAARKSAGRRRGSR